MNPTPQKEARGCMAQTPTFNDDGTEKDIDYWVYCSHSLPCPYHFTSSIDEVIDTNERKLEMRPIEETAYAGLNVEPPTPTEPVDEFVFRWNHRDSQQTLLDAMISRAVKPL